jgi:lysozyme
MNEELSLSRNGADLIKAFESCEKKAGPGRFKAYFCPAGVLTIGWGHTNDSGRRFSAGEAWSQEECDAAFEDDMKVFEDAVRRNVRTRLNQDQYDALVSFTYNVGETNLRRSTLLRKLNDGDFEGAAHEFCKWNKGGGKVLAGLVRRRASEALLFQGIADRDHDGSPDGRMAKTTAAHPSGILKGAGLF